MGRKEDMLYRKIMSNVSKQLDRIINEAENDIQTEVQKAADAICATNKTKEQLQGAINMLKAVSAGNGNFKYKGGSYKDLIPELERRLTDKKSINERTRRSNRR